MTAHVNANEANEIYENMMKNSRKVILLSNRYADFNLLKSKLSGLINEMTTVNMSDTKIQVKYAIHCGMMPVNKKNDTSNTETVIAVTTATVLVFFHQRPSTIGKNGAPTNPPAVKMAVNNDTFCNKIVAITIIIAITTEETRTTVSNSFCVAFLLIYIW